MRKRINLFWIPLLTGLTVIQTYAIQSHTTDDFLSMSLEELARVKISSVSKQEEQFVNAPASLYVITRNAIRNSGATSIPEALRLAPNLQVARINATNYAITARGFNALISNKLLVLIDGRTVYTPLFSGVFWDQQDILLEDVERIEVISGPGATLWGVNAVNGVINIITRSSEDTQGLLASVYAGNQERGAAFRYGGALGDSGSFRVYAKGLELDHTELADDARQRDAFERIQTGFRADWEIGADRFTISGDIYDGETEDRIVARPVEGSGHNLLARWNRALANGSNIKIQAYWDHIERVDAALFQPEADIYDIEFQHTLRFATHKILWGGGYRHGHDDVTPGFFSTFVPASRNLNWENLFVQDEIQLGENVTSTLGLRMESNDYTGTEYLPSVRLAWKLSDGNLIWSAVSRAVRAPSRFDREVYFPAPPNSIVVGGPNFESEVANVFELGYRSLASESIFYSITAFYHDWDKLRSGTAIPVELENKIEGPVYGLEAWLDYQITEDWRLSAGGTTLKKDLELKPDSTDPTGVENDTLHNDPDYQLMVRLLWEVNDTSVFNLSLRHVAELPHPEVPSYTAVDAYYGWQMRDNLEVSVTARNITDNEHREFERPINGSEFERSIIFKIVWAI